MTESKINFGVLLPTREAVMSGRSDPTALFELAERAEALGFHSVWVGDSLTARPRIDALTTLAAVGARTRRVRLGTVPAMGTHTVTVSEVRRAVTPLLLGSLCAQLLLNGPPVLIPALAANEAEITRAGQFIAAFTLARVPLFLVVPLQTAL